MRSDERRNEFERKREETGLPFPIFYSRDVFHHFREFERLERKVYAFFQKRCRYICTAREESIILDKIVEKILLLDELQPQV